MKNKISFSELINGEKPVLVDFYADWCGPCQAMNPILKELAGELKNEVRIIKIDIEKNQAIVAKHEIRGVPTFMLFQNGKVKWRQSGMLSAHHLKQVIEKETEPV